MPADLTQLDNRLALIKATKSTQNKGRKAESLRQVEIFNDRIFEHVWERLARRFSRETVSEMPLVSSVNIARRIAKQEASIYKQPPKREWTDLSDDQFETMNRIYANMGFDSKMLKSNESFKLQNQNHVMIVPVDGKLQMRVLRNHHIDSIDSDDPENPAGYIISSIDKNDFRRKRRNEQGGSGFRGRYDSWSDVESNFTDEAIGDEDDFLKQQQRYVVWTKEFNFVMNGKGEIVSGEDITNPLGMVPIVDISIEKDFEYWVRQGDSLSEFTIEYNTALSSISQIVLMQGFAQAFLIAKDDVIPQNMQIGPNFIVKLPMEEGSGVRPEFGYAQPGSDISGSISFAEVMLSNYLTSRGADPKLISGSGEASSFNSGIERLLSMIETFEASRSDFDTYKKAEMDIYRIIKGWHNVSIGTGILDPEFVSSTIPESSELMIMFAGPEMIKTEGERVDTWTKRIEAGESTVVDMMMDLRGVDKEAALDLIKENREIERQIDDMMMEGMDANISERQNSNEETDS